MSTNAGFICSFILIVFLIINFTVLDAAGQENEIDAAAQVNIGPVSCADGYVAKGIECKAQNCQKIELICRSYHENYDSQARYTPSGWFPDDDRSSAKNEEGFISGFTKRGNLIKLDFVITPKLLNQKKCFWKTYLNKARKICKNGLHLSGLGYKDKEFKKIQLYCCQSEIQNDPNKDDNNQEN